MDLRTKELVAVGASLTANCQPCLEYHVRKARESGAAQKDILEAVAVGRKVRHGAQHKMDNYAEALLQEVSDEESSDGAACGCGTCD